MEHLLMQHQEGFHNSTCSGVSRCFLGVYIYPLFRLQGGARRWHQHRGWGVVPLVGLWCWESLRRVGEACDVASFLDALLVRHIAKIIIK